MEYSELQAHVAAVAKLARLVADQVAGAATLSGDVGFDDLQAVVAMAERAEFADQYVSRKGQAHGVREATSMTRKELAAEARNLALVAATVADRFAEAYASESHETVSMGEVEFVKSAAHLVNGVAQAMEMPLR